MLPAIGSTIMQAILPGIAQRPGQQHRRSLNGNDSVHAAKSAGTPVNLAVRASRRRCLPLPAANLNDRGNNQ